MQQFGAFMFHTVVHWHKFGKVDTKYILHNSVILASCKPKIIKIGGDLTKLWQKQFWLFFETLCIFYYFWCCLNVNATPSNFTMFDDIDSYIKIAIFRWTFILYCFGKLGGKASLGLVFFTWAFLKAQRVVVRPKNSVLPVAAGKKVRMGQIC